MQYSFILFQIKLLFLRFLYILIIFLTQKYNIQNIFKLSFTHIDRFDILRCCSFRLFSHNSLRNTRIMHTHTRCWNTISDHVFRTKLIEGCSKITLATFQGVNTPLLSPPFFLRNRAFIGMSSSVHHRARRAIITSHAPR